MKGKILIWLEEERIKPEGGPAGYLYNLNNFFKKTNNKDIKYKPKLRKIYKFKKKLKRYFYKKVYKGIEYQKKEL